MIDKGSVIAGIERFLNIIWLAGEVRELRGPKHNKYGHTLSGYFDSPAALAKTAVDYDGKANLYITLNPVGPALMELWGTWLQWNMQWLTAKANDPQN